MSEYELIRDSCNIRNPNIVKNMYRELIERNHRKYLERGIHYDPDRRALAILKPPEEQAREAKCGVREFGAKVVEMAQESTEQPFEKSLFARCFAYPEVAKSSYDLTLGLAESKMQGPIVILPPLLCRSTTSRVCSFEGAGRDTMVPSKDPARTSLVLVLSDRGYVIPVVRADAIATVAKRLVHLYVIQGRCPLRHIVEAATGH